MGYADKRVSKILALPNVWCGLLDFGREVRNEPKARESVDHGDDSVHNLDVRFSETHSLREQPAIASQTSSASQPGRNDHRGCCRSLLAELQPADIISPAKDTKRLLPHDVPYCRYSGMNGRTQF